MGLAEILLGVAFSVLISIGGPLALSDPNYVEFWVACLCPYCRI